MCCHSCGHWNRCPRCTGNICEMCGEDLAQPPNEKEANEWSLLREMERKPM